KELAAWTAVKDTADRETLEAFLRDWPDSPHTVEAIRLTALPAFQLQAANAADQPFAVASSAEKPVAPGVGPRNAVQFAIKALFTRPKGRISRKPFWIALAGCVLLELLVNSIFGTAHGDSLIAIALKSFGAIFGFNSPPVIALNVGDFL